jgi:hypothetical protein
MTSPFSLSLARVLRNVKPCAESHVELDLTPCREVVAKGLADRVLEIPAPLPLGSWLGDLDLQLRQAARGLLLLDRLFCDRICGGSSFLGCCRLFRRHDGKRCLEKRQTIYLRKPHLS